MATQIIMDHNGDTRHSFDAQDVKALLEAEPLQGTYGCWLHCGNSYYFWRSGGYAQI